MRQRGDLPRRSIRLGLLAMMLAAVRAEARQARGDRPPEAIAAIRSETAPGRLDRVRRPPLAGPSWTGMAWMALALAGCGALAVAARRLKPGASAGSIRVVGRVGLSPRHSVYLLQVGGRTLVVGAGPQGPPALIAELDDLPSESSAPRAEGTA